MPFHTVHVIDSHTEGEPTRVVLEGGPNLGSGSLAQRAARFRAGHDGFRSALMNEPRGLEIAVGALLLPPSDPSACCGVLFFNNAGLINMCVHGSIGVVATLRHLDRLPSGACTIETPVGSVSAAVQEDGSISVENVLSYRTRHSVPVDVPGYGTVLGDVAWGGNWFFLTENHGQEIHAGNIPALDRCAWAIRRALASSGITGEDGGEVDHIELFGPPSRPDASSKNFVLCPGGAYDRSPCGTGASAKLACLSAASQLEPGQTWIQESIIGSAFRGFFRPSGRGIIPTITGSAWLTADARLLLDPADPFRDGIPASRRPSDCGEYRRSSSRRGAPG